jgi:peptidoglycan/LPS O-acetylase OafA/YrhL
MQLSESSLEAGIPQKNPEKVSSKVTYPALDGLRAIAVTLVFMDHFGGGSHGGVFLQWFNHLRVFGPAGVSLFFVLSGFLITGILYDTQSSKHFFKNFYARRSLRIFPIFYLVAAVCVILAPILHFQFQWEHLSFLFYLGNFFANWNWSLYELYSPTHPALSINMGHFWSLFVEEQFYLIWPVVIFTVRDRVKLLRLSLIVVVLVLLLRVSLVLSLPFELVERFAFRMLPTRADDLLVGAALALLLRGPNVEKWLKRSWTFFAVGAAAFAIMGIWRGNFGFYDPYNITIGLDFISFSSAGMIALVIQNNTAIFRLFSIRPLRALGRYSYGFYIYHILLSRGHIVFLQWCEAYFHSMLIGGLVFAFTSFMGTFIVSGVSYEFFEKRFLAMKSRFPYG